MCWRTHACESRQVRSRWMWGCLVPRACSFAKKTCASEVAIASVVLARREHDRAAYMQTYPERGGCFPTHARVRQRDAVRAHARPRARLSARRRARRAAAAHSALRDGCFATHRPHAYTSRLPLAHRSRCGHLGAAARRQVHDAYMHALAEACEREAARARQAGEPARYVAMQRL